jgi:ABC-2 type transport system ATP-binding protein
MSLPTESSVADRAAENSSAAELTGVGVRYRRFQEPIASFKELVVRRLGGTIRRHDFWALKNVSVSIPRGEALAVVGRNGAGKSTLLKVLARVLRPTLGRAVVRGHVAPLLELGAGFDWELSGRENVFLNGTILGFTHRELRARFERIVEFAGLDAFIDSPLRTYSSGMVARLGFSVATDERPDVLLVDEVLAVGDAEFQARCMRRIHKYLSQGTTLALVSHDLTTLRAMCNRAVWLERGEVRAHGSAEEVIGLYGSESGHPAPPQSPPDGSAETTTRRPSTRHRRVSKSRSAAG